MLHVEVVSTEDLGDRSYVAHDGEVALVVDPQRDIDRVECVLADLGLKCALVVETHVHNDYVSGGSELAARAGATYALATDGGVAVQHRSVSDGDQLHAGRLRVRVIATPGHTVGHVSYVVDDGSGSVAAFTGGSLLYGSVGRTDLVDPRRTDELTRAQYHSVRHLAGLLADDTPVFPTHGFGSFCSAGSATGGTASTIGVERQRNDALVIEDEEEFVAKLVAGLTAFPSYYVHMAPLNRQGPAPVDLSYPDPTDSEQLIERIRAGEWVVDLRSSTAFAANHIEGTISIGLGQGFSTYLGWLIPWDMPLTLIGSSAHQVADAQRQLVRIGIDRPKGAAVGTPEELAGGGGRLHSFPTASMEDLHHEPGAVVLDVRGDDERSDGYLRGSLHMPLHLLLDHLDDLPEGRLWVHCASAYRAGIAASLLDRAGRDVVLIDDTLENARTTMVVGDV